MNWLNHIKKLNDQLVDIWIEFGYFYLTQQEFQVAKTWFEKVLKVDPDSIVAQQGKKVNPYFLLCFLNSCQFYF